ncbi:hypothetical protein SAMN05421824_0270 [Hyunsoonleella jejuensis]|uniref:Lipocalin-like domain-containing protein n=1 Tax=Hyunsoonleella jejuensis TaxID=419940 RepID=A0A1H9AK11_9FLAO|nr:hypothetical protein [Hyunsoonleella jejuensis]SEP77070.1 hypothetical protein SAMN05421824_0270 [Hyunsoonleella jejuensis]
MKTIKIVALLILLITLSCSKSSDEEEIQDKEAAIEGVWLLRDITEINLEGNAVPAELSREICAVVELIIIEGCELMAFEFKPDQSFILEQYDVNDYNPSEDEVEYVVNCENIDLFIGTWGLQDGQLVLSGEENESNSFSIKLESSLMIWEDVPLGAILPIDGQGDFVFEKLGNG